MSVLNQKGWKRFMEKIYQGKTKDVYKLENGNVLLKFKTTAQVKMVYSIPVKTPLV